MPFPLSVMNTGQAHRRGGGGGPLERAFKGSRDQFSVEVEVEEKGVRLDGRQGPGKSGSQT